MKKECLLVWIKILHRKVLFTEIRVQLHSRTNNDKDFYTTVFIGRGLTNQHGIYCRNILCILLSPTTKLIFQWKVKINDTPLPPKHQYVINI